MQPTAASLVVQSSPPGLAAARVNRAASSRSIASNAAVPSAKPLRYSERTGVPLRGLRSHPQNLIRFVPAKGERWIADKGRGGRARLDRSSSTDEATRRQRRGLVEEPW